MSSESIWPTFSQAARMFLALPPPVKAVVSLTGVMGRNKNRKHFIDLISSLRLSQDLTETRAMGHEDEKGFVPVRQHLVTVGELSTVYPGLTLGIKSMQ